MVAADVARLVKALPVEDVALRDQLVRVAAIQYGLAARDLAP